jgi:hypothetical protein
MSNIQGAIYGGGILIFIFWFFFGVVIFLLFREIILWYWRINENTESLKRIADSLENISMVVNLAVVDSSKQDANNKTSQDVEAKKFKKKTLSNN